MYNEDGSTVPACLMSIFIYIFSTSVWASSFLWSLCRAFSFFSICSLLFLYSFCCFWCSLCLSLSAISFSFSAPSFYFCWSYQISFKTNAYTNHSTIDGLHIFFQLNFFLHKGEKYIYEFTWKIWISLRNIICIIKCQCDKEIWIFQSKLKLYSLNWKYSFTSGKTASESMRRTVWRSLHSCWKRKPNKPLEVTGVLQSAQAVYLVLSGEAIWCWLHLSLWASAITPKHKHVSQSTWHYCLSEHLNTGHWYFIT